MTMMTMTIKITMNKYKYKYKKDFEDWKKKRGQGYTEGNKRQDIYYKPKIDCPGFGGKWNEKKNTCEAFPDPESQTDWEDTVCDDPKDTDRYPEVCQPDSKEYAEQQERALKVDLEAREKVLKESEEWQKEQEKKRAEYGYDYHSYEEYNEIVEPLL